MLVVTPTGLKEIKRADYCNDRAYYKALQNLVRGVILCA